MPWIRRRPSLTSLDTRFSDTFIDLEIGTVGPSLVSSVVQHPAWGSGPEGGETAPFAPHEIAPPPRIIELGPFSYFSRFLVL